MSPRGVSSRSSGPAHREAFLSGVLLAVLSGCLIGWAFPPVGWTWTVWFGLAPLLVAVQRTRSTLRAALYGLAAGFTCFLFAAHPLTSASLWTGWASTSAAGLAQMKTRQWWFLNGLWLGICLLIALFWALFAVMVRRLEGRRVWGVVVIPALWLVLPEWARSQASWGFQWGFLGNAVAVDGPIRQLASIGGVWALSALAVMVNVGVASAVVRRSAAGWSRWGPLTVSGCGVLLALAFGAWRMHRPLAEARALRAVVIQGRQISYRQSDFLPYGLDRNYYALLARVVQSNPDLVVLPESVAFGPISLDGSRDPGQPSALHHPVSAWNAAIGSLLYGSRTIVAIGADVVHAERAHNSILFWQGGRFLGAYDKRHLVPFAEYRPHLWGRAAIRGRKGYAPGKGAQVIRAGSLPLGAFVCQEVLFPGAIRDTVRAGAELLVSGGNDGVFANPAVARVHDDLVALRATETGRYIVRAMKSGISSIVDPFGRHLVRSGMNDTEVLSATVHPLDTMTIYDRWGDWVLWLSLLISAALVVTRLAAVVRERSRADG